MTYFLDLFKPIHANTIALFAKLFSALWLVMLLVHFKQQLRFFKTEPIRISGNPQKLLGIYQLPLISPAWFATFGLILLGSLLAITLGFLPRFFVLIALVCYFPYFNSIQSLAHIQRKTNLAAFVLLVLLVSPSLNTPLNLPTSNWEVLLIKIGMAQMYLSAGLHKLRSSGLKWANGAALQAYLAENHFWNGYKMGWLVAQHRGLCCALSVWALCFEFTFWLILFFPSLTVFYILCSFCFHLSVQLTVRVHYLIYLSPVYMIFWRDFVSLFVNSPIF